jgi:hypothetical protein
VREIYLDATYTTLWRGSKTGHMFRFHLRHCFIFGSVNNFTFTNAVNETAYWTLANVWVINYKSVRRTVLEMCTAVLPRTGTQALRSCIVHLFPD